MRETNPPPVAGRFLAVLALGLAGWLFIDALFNAPNVLADWHAYYRAARNLLLGGDLYAEAATLLERNSYEYWLETDGQYVYPPLLALVLTPLAALLDIGKGGDVWLLLLAAATLGCLVILARLRRVPPTPEALAPLALPVLAAVPVLLGIRYGQADLPLTLLLLLGLLAHVGGREVLAGLALGAAAAVKPTLALYGLYYLRQRRWRTLLAAGLTGLLVGLAPFLLLRPGGLDRWLSVARYFSTGDYAAYPSNQSLRGLLLRAFDGGPRHLPLLEARPLADALWLAAIVAALVVWWRCVGAGGGDGRRATLEFGLTAVLVLFAAPLSEDIHYVALLIPLAALADAAAREPAPGRAWPLLVALACLYFMQPWLDFAYNRGGEGRRGLLYSGAYLYGLLLVGGALVWRLWPARRVAPQPLPESEAHRGVEAGG